MGKLYSALSIHHQPRKIVLLYHSVGTSPWAISVDCFKKQIRWLKQHYDVVSLDSLLSDIKQNKKTAVALTFDDGYSCLYHTVFPILQAENTVATIYLNTDWIAEDEKVRKQSNPALGHYPQEQFLIWPEIKILKRAGWIIGSHGANHLDLTKQSNSVILGELMRAKATIETQLQKPCEHFAYTFGNHVKQLRCLVCQVGYRYAVAGHHAVLKSNVNNMAIPRVNIEIGYSFSDFKDIILGKWDFLGAIHRIKQMRNK